MILQGLDYALSNDHPDVISESFGGYPIPDTTQDLTRQFNEQAVAAGVTVVESTGDSGVESSPSSPSSDPSVIAAGASTTFRNYAQGRSTSTTRSAERGPRSSSCATAPSPVPCTCSSPPRASEPSTPSPRRR